MDIFFFGPSIDKLIGDRLSGARKNAAKSNIDKWWNPVQQFWPLSPSLFHLPFLGAASSSLLLHYTTLCLCTILALFPFLPLRSLLLATCTVRKLPLEAFQQTRFANKFVKKTFGSDKRGGGIEFGNGTAVEDYDAVRIEDGIDSVSDGDDCAVAEDG